MAQDGSEKQAGPGASAGGQGTSGDKEPELIPVEEAEKRAQKAASDALAKAGRDAKALEQKGKDLETREGALKTELEQWQKERDEAELAAARDDADRLPLVQEKQALRRKEEELNEKEAKLERDKAQHQAELDEAATTKKQTGCWKIAQQYAEAIGAEVGELAVKLKELDLDLEATEKVAKAWSEGRTPEPPKVDKDGNPFKPLSGRTSGGGEKSQDERLKERYPKM